MAAGLGFKDFTTGEVLTAADVDGYLMQGIWVFASTAARDAAVTAPAEGNFAFTKDTNSLWYYDGATWVASGAAGDIEGVTAGVGISGGGTSGTVTVTNSMATAIDAKGDLVAGTGADTFARLAVGANDTVLTADSTTATGLKWAAPAGGGSNFVALNGAGTALSGSSTSITGLSGNDKFYVYVYGAGTSATATISMTFNSDTSSKYGGDALELGASSTALNIVGTSFTGLNGDTSIPMSNATSASGVNMTLFISGGNSSGAKISNNLVGTSTVNGNSMEIRTSIYTGTAVISSIQFKTSTGTFTGGTVYIYGSA